MLASSLDGMGTGGATTTTGSGAARREREIYHQPTPPHLFLAQRTGQLLVNVVDYVWLSLQDKILVDVGTILSFVQSDNLPIHYQERL